MSRMNETNPFSRTRTMLNTTKRLGLLAIMTALGITPPIVQGATLAEALNTTNLTWATSGTYGSSGWISQTGTSHDGVSAADSGRLVYYLGTCTLQTTVTGPGTITFWWSNPSFSSRLYFNVNGTPLNYITAYGTGWQQQTFYLGAGSQTLQWVFSVAYPPADSSHSYVDQVSYTPGAVAPLITSQPIGQSQVPGMNATFTVGAGGTPPLYYQWKLNGTNISGATTSAYTVTNAQAGNLGDYSVELTNSVASIVSSNAALQFGAITSWGYGDTAVYASATNVAAMAAGFYLNLLVNADSTVSGWGVYMGGPATVPANLSNAIAVACYNHCLALKSDGTVTAWGANYAGETNVPAGLSNVVAIAAARSPHSLALKSDGTVAAWGGYSFAGETNVPAGLTNVVAIAAGYSCDLALKADGTLTTWGAAAPAVPTGLSNVMAIAAGSLYNLALLTNGTVVAWGNNSYGQTNVPTGLANVVAIAAGDTHGLALLSNGTVVAWGDNSFGQTNVPAGLTNVAAIAAGGTQNLARVGSGPPVQRAPVINPILSGISFSFQVPSQSGRVYALEHKDNLSDANWVSLPLAAGTGTNLVLLDPTATNAQRFYRVRQW